MSLQDWVVMLSVLGGIVIYGAWKTKQENSLSQFILGDQTNTWWKVGFAVMATQASAITFISTTGQGFTDGLRFVQFYFGLPLAMIVICITFIPRFYKMGVYTAYEYLEHRFDLRTRLLAALIFLIQRGMAAGITLYAPSIILSTLFDWNLQWTHIISGTAVILYTVSGGANAVTKTQLQQLLVIFIGMVFIFVYMLFNLPPSIHFSDILELSSKSGKMEAVDFSLNFETRYNFWAGITGGFFLALAYFGTDQSQVQRYLSGKNISESRMGLLMNGILKIPMQVMILFCGVTLFVVYLFIQQPLHFNDKASKTLMNVHPEKWSEWNERNDSLFLDWTRFQEIKQNGTLENHLTQIQNDRKQLQSEIKEYLKKHHPETEVNDKDYIFLHYILHHLPKGFIGLMIAVILCAAMSSISAELNALAATSTVDIVKRLFPKWFKNYCESFWSRSLTIAWGMIAIGFALYAQLFENLIQFINIIGSLFYGTVLGIFLCAFYSKNLTSKPVFLSSLIAQITILVLFFFTEIGFLWYNVISCSMVVLLAWLIQKMKFTS